MDKAHEIPRFARNYKYIYFKGGGKSPPLPNESLHRTKPCGFRVMLILLAGVSSLDKKTHLYFRWAFPING